MTKTLLACLFLALGAYVIGQFDSLMLGFFLFVIGGGILLSTKSSGNSLSSKSVENLTNEESNTNAE